MSKQGLISSTMRAPCAPTFVCLSVLVTLLGCGIERSAHEAVLAENGKLSQKAAALEAKLSKLEAELGEIRTTDQGLWRTAKTLDMLKKWQDLESTLDDLLERWPESPLTKQATALRKTAREQSARRLYQYARTAIDAGEEASARRKLAEIVKNFPETPTGKRAKIERSQVEKKLKAASKKERRKRKRSKPRKHVTMRFSS